MKICDFIKQHKNPLLIFLAILGFVIIGVHLYKQHQTISINSIPDTTVASIAGAQLKKWPFYQS